MSQRIFGIVAPPRGGGSLVASLVDAAGIALGDQESFKPALPGAGTSCGFEHALFEEVYDRLSMALRHPWFSSVPLAENWTELAPAQRALADLQDILSWAPISEEAWGWKSSQAAPFLPLWEELAAANGAELRLIVPVRNPLVTARSLHRIARLPESQGLRLWLATMLAVLERRSQVPVCFCSDEAILSDPEGQSRRLLKFLGREADPETVARMVACVTPASRRIPAVSEEETAASAEAADLYRHCLTLASDLSSVPAGQLKSLEDYRRMAALFRFGWCDVAPRWAMGSLAMDLGNGLQEDPTQEQLLPNGQDFRFEVEFSIPPKVRRILFIPCRAPVFRCRIERIESPGGPLAVCGHSARNAADGWEIFVAGENSTPGYEVACGPVAAGGRIRIQGRIEIAAPRPSSFNEEAP